MSLPLHTRALVEGHPSSAILKVLALDEFLRSRHDPLQCALWLDESDVATKSRAAIDLNWGAIVASNEKVRVPESHRTSCVVKDIRDRRVVDAGDVIRISERQNLISVLHRRRSRTNSLLVTERCNSYCLMCSQPPIERVEDSSRIDELLEIVRLIDPTESVLGITGGEPTLFGSDFVRLLRGCRSILPKSAFHVLTNGRTFSDEEFAAECSNAAGDAVMWGIPLYTDAPEIHDFVVQRQGAFIETMKGLMHLARQGQRIELRIVLQQATAPRLVQFAEFIVRNLNFVEHVAWMGLEPMGFARPNWNSIWKDPSEYTDELTRAIEIVDRADIHTSIFNLPLCVLPTDLRPFAAQSISDWKNDFADECTTCSVKDRCCGFFTSARNGFLPGRVTPIRQVAPIPDDLER
jgi:His-Xaa-Ser system radical SAM maturase HxsC